MPKSIHPFQVAFCGFSNSGKTTLMSRLVSSLKNRYAIGYYKHGCHHLDIDREGKDSSVVRESGADFPLCCATLRVTTLYGRFSKTIPFITLQ